MLKSISIDQTDATGMQERIDSQNQVRFSHVMFTGGNTTGTTQTAELLLRIDGIFERHRPLVQRDSGKISEIAVQFAETDTSLARQLNNENWKKEVVGNV